VHAEAQEGHATDAQLFAPAHLPVELFKQRFGDQAGFCAQRAHASGGGLVLHRLNQAASASLLLGGWMAIEQSQAIVGMTQAEGLGLILGIAAHKTLALAE